MKKVNWISLLKRIPHIVTFKKAKYEILWVDKFPDNKTMGETRYDPKQIVIARHPSEKELVHTYIHEVIHAVDNEFEVGLTETQVRKLEKALYWVLKPGNLFKEKE